MRVQTRENMGFSSRRGGEERRNTEELAVTVSECRQLAWRLLGVDELFELRFGEDCDA